MLESLQFRFKTLEFFVPIILMFLTLFLGVCKREEIVSYDSYNYFGTAKVKERSNQKIFWTTLKYWKEFGATAMRAGTVLIEGMEGKKAEVSVIPLAGSAGGHLANVNRWRSKFQLEPINEAGLEQQLKIISSPAGDIFPVDFVSSEHLIDGKFKSRLIAAILSQDDITCFLKMIGEDLLVSSFRREFEKFLGSMHVSRNE
ncbi:MAG: hypothetical protein GYA55_00970 [SAR324 cluster bacterium]|uniref:Uncharacterized protein n=1 Tax=SAR324 cluster bacterium TaxID=2024889 RepID=A0A7X9FPA6_9DELT|nr:hypothetical protein [SAR324 cluster bacterium]